MLKLVHHQLLTAAGKKSSGENGLCLSWLNGSVKGLAVQEGEASSPWEYAGAVEEPANFAAVVKEAKAQTGYHGAHIIIALSQYRLTQQLVETPPIKGPVLDRFVQRQVQTLKTFPAPPAWSHQPALPTKNSSSLVLHLIPKPLVDQLQQACKESGLHLVKLIPITAVVHQHLLQLPLEKEEIALLAAETGGSTTVVVGRPDGEIYLARTLNASWNNKLPHFLVDLNRTILFINQQFGVSVSRVWAFGAGAAERAEEMQAQLRLPVQVSPVQATPAYWAEQTLQLQLKHVPNLITLEEQKAPERRRALVGMSFLVGLLLVLTLILLGFLEWQIHSDRGSLAKITPQLEQLQEDHKQWQQRFEDLALKRSLLKIINDDRLQPVPSWFLGYLSEVMPPGLLLTNLQVRHQETLWSVRLAGVPQPTTNRVEHAAFSNTVATLTYQLNRGPFHFALTSNEIKGSEAPARGLNLSLPGGRWNKLTSLGLAGSSEGANSFVVEGLLK